MANNSSGCCQPTTSQATTEPPADNLHIPAFTLATYSAHALTTAAAPMPSEAVLLEHQQVLFEIRGFFVCIHLHVAELLEREWGKLMSDAYPELALYGPLTAQIHALVVRNLLYRNSLDANMPGSMHDFIEYCCGVGNLTLGCSLANLQFSSVVFFVDMWAA